MTNAIEAQSVLVVDDEPGMRCALRTSFEQAGWDVQSASGVNEALQKLAIRRPNLVVTDVRMPDGNGLEVMRTVRRTSPSTAVIVLTAFGNVPEAVQAIRNGACDYLMKPVSFEQLKSSVARVMQNAVSSSQPTVEAHGIVGRSPELIRVLDRAQHVARTGADVLIEAESGTGKELLARFLHDMSARRNKPFVAVNCAAVPEQLLETELFGHTKGAFTGAIGNKQGKFEAADGGTILLDEIGDMPLALQPKLLRVLQEREFEPIGGTKTQTLDIRVIATTNVSLQAKVDEGRFRADLYYRLNVIPLSLPPLRDRKSDLALLAEHFAAKFAAEAHRNVPELLPEFLNGLQDYDWPGNVRELGNFMRRVITLSQGCEIGAEYLTSEFLARRVERRAPVPAGISIRELERSLLENALHMTDGNRTQAAEMLGVSLRTVRNKIRQYGLPPRRYA